MATTLDLLKRLADRNVELVVVGGLAGIIHGSALVTEDVDVCAPLTPENLSRILAALRELHPRFRMNPGHPPLPDDAAKLAGFKNLYLMTDLGQIDLMSEISGLGPYADVAGHAVTVDVGGVRYSVLSLEGLIRSKKALGRPKDLRAARELEALRQRNRGHGGGGGSGNSGQ
jgi:predicted nucleotidyltransferase